MKEICSIKEFVLLDSIERNITEIERVLKKLQKRDIAFLGNTGLGKSFLLNLLFVMTVVDSREYISSKFRNSRKELRKKCDESVELIFVEDGAECLDLPVLRILQFPHCSTSPQATAGSLLPSSDVGAAVPGLEALRSLDCKLNVVFVNPVPYWEAEDELAEAEERFSDKFVSRPDEDHEYRLKRFEGTIKILLLPSSLALMCLFSELIYLLLFSPAEYCETKVLKEKENPDKLKNFLLPSFDEKYKATSVVSVQNSFGCTFHVSLEFLSESEIKGRAEDWISVVRRGISLQNDRLKVREVYEFLRKSFEVLYPSLAQVVENARTVQELPYSEQILRALDPHAKTLMKQKFHIFSGQAINFYQDQLFIMKTLEQQLGIGMEGRARSEIVKCYMIKKVTNYVPSLLLASGCSITDTPGTGDRGLLQKFLVQQALEKHDVVVAICKSSLQLEESTYDALFKKPSSSSFISRLWKDPSGKNLVVMHYYERTADRDKQRILSKDSKQRKDFRETKQLMEEKSQREAKNGAADVKARLEALRSIPNVPLDSCITSFTTFPIMYFSLILNSKFSEELEADGIFDDVISSTEGHKFLVLPEYLESNRWRQEIGKLRAVVTEKGEQIREDMQTYILSSQAKDNIRKFIEFCDGSKNKTHASMVKLYKDAIAGLGSAHKSRTRHAWDTLQVGDVVEGVFLNLNGRTEIYAVGVSSISSKYWEIVYLAEDLSPWKDEFDNETRHRVKFKPVSDTDKKRGSKRVVETVSDTSEGQTVALKLEELSIDKAIDKFRDSKGRRGFVTALLDRQFAIFQSELEEKLAPHIISEMRKDFEELREAEESVQDFEVIVDEVFAQTSQGKSHYLNIVDKILKYADQQLHFSFCSSDLTTEQQLRLIHNLEGTFDFKNMMYSLRKELSGWQQFIADGISEVVFEYTCSYEGDEELREKDKRQIGQLFSEYMEAGSKTLQTRLDKVFSLTVDESELSKVPDYNFFSKQIRMKVEGAVIDLLKQVVENDAQEKVEYLLSRVGHILNEALISLKKDLQSMFDKNLANLKRDLLPSQKDSLSSFTHEFIYEFIQKLDNTTNRSAEAHSEFFANFNCICTAVDNMLISLPKESDVGIDIYKHMKHSKVLREVQGRIDRLLMKSIVLKFSSSQIFQDVLCLKNNFAEMGSYFSKRMTFESARGIRITEEFFNKIGFKLLIDKSESHANTLWRALATQFKPLQPFQAPDINVLEAQLRAAVADQILYAFKPYPKAIAKAMLGTSSEDFACKILKGEMLAADVEICLYFFVLCFCKAKATDQKMKGINIWFHGCKFPKFQIAFPSSTENIRNQFYLQLQESRHPSAFHEFGKQRDGTSMFVIDIVIYAEDKDESKDACLRVAGLEWIGRVQQDLVNADLSPTATNRTAGPLKRERPSNECGLEEQQKGEMRQNKSSRTDLMSVARPASSGLGGEKSTSLRVPQPQQTTVSRGMQLGQRAPVLNTDKPEGPGHSPSNSGSFEEIVASRLTNDCVRMLFFEFDALYRLFICERTSRPARLVNLIRSWRKEGETIVVLISHVVEAKLAKYTEVYGRDTVRNAIDSDFRDKVRNCGQLRNAINKTFTVFGDENPEERIHFILQSSEHQKRCCGNPPWNMLFSVFQCARSVFDLIQRQSIIMDVIVADETGAQGILNQCLPDIRGKLNIVPHLDLLRTFQRTKAQAILKRDAEPFFGQRKTDHAQAIFHPRIRNTGPGIDRGGAAVVRAYKVGSGETGFSEGVEAAGVPRRDSSAHGRGFVGISAAAVDERGAPPPPRRGRGGAAVGRGASFLAGGKEVAKGAQGRSGAEVVDDSDL